MEGRKGVGSVNRGRPAKNLGVSKTKIIKKKKRINFLNKIPGLVNYLKCDSFLYSPLISSSLPRRFTSQRDDIHLPSTGLERNEPMFRNGGKMKEKVVKYLKSDAFLYAPLEDTTTRQRGEATAKNVIFLPRGLASKEVPFTSVTRTVLSKKIAWQTKRVSDRDPGVDKRGDFDIPPADDVTPETPGIPEIKKRATRRSGRVPTLSG